VTCVKVRSYFKLFHFHSFISFFLFQDGFSGLVCPRCELRVHVDCKKDAGRCKPLHKNLILREEEEEKRKPLLVFVNSRSGSKDFV